MPRISITFTFYPSLRYQGMSFQDLYQRCRAEFLVNSDLTLKAQVSVGELRL